MNEYDVFAAVITAMRDDALVKLTAAHKSGTDLLSALHAVAAERDAAVKERDAARADAALFRDAFLILQSELGL